ncbi:MAG: ParA family protein [Candidatus Marinamargulisbacteria bacterium]
MMSNGNAFCVINYKGGTGKTCTLVNIAHGLSLKGKKVLVIDTDPQGSVSYHFGVTPKKTLYDIIVKNSPVSDCITLGRDNIDIIASNEHLFPAENHMHQQPNRETILKQRVSQSFENYDYVLIDCAPSINLMNQNALIAAPNLLIPVSMDYMTLLGVKQLINNAKLLNKHFNATIKVSKIIPTFYNNHNKKTKHVYESLERAFSDELASPIRTNVSISEAAGQGKTIFEYVPSGPAADDFNKLTEEVLNYER